MTELPVSHSGWEDIQTSLASVKDLLDACYSAWGPEDQKVSATTKKRLAARALKGLEQGQELLKVLTVNLQQLEQSSKLWQRNVSQASQSHKDLMLKLEHTSDDLHSSNDRLRQAEADRVACQREMNQLRQQLTADAADKEALTKTINQLEHDLRAANFGANEANCHLTELRAQVDQLAAATKEAEEGASAAAGALSAAQQEAEKERAARKRHEDAIARLTADNLVFMAKLRAAESEAETATAERNELLLALEEHKGPWMDEVHKGVEQRVKEALAHAEQLEQQQELTAKQTAEQIAQLQQQQADLEAQLAAARVKHTELEQQLAAAQTAEREAHLAAEEAQTLAAEAQAAADARAAELRVAQDSLKSMREECNERWMSERSARAQLAEQQSQLAAAETDTAKLKKSLQSRSDELMTQRAVNQQLMLKKEEVEWQLMAAIAKLKDVEASHQSGSPVSDMQSPMSSAAPADSTDMASVSSGGSVTTPDAASTAGIRVCNSVSAGGPADALAGPSFSCWRPGQQQGAPCCRSPEKSVITAAALAGGSSCGACGAVASPGAVHLPYDTFSALEAAASGKSPFGMVPPSSFPASPSIPPSPPTVAGTTTAVLGLHINTTGVSICGSGSVRPGSATASAPRPSAFTSATATAAAALGVGSVGGSAAAASPSLLLPPGLHASGSSANSVPDMFTLPSLSYGLATLPPPELLVAAASGQLGHRGSLGLSGVNSSSLGGVLSPDASVRGKGVVVGTTGGLMAPFSPLPRAPSISFPTGIGAVFPACATASAVTDSEQLDSHSLCSMLPSLVPKRQQQQEPQVVSAAAAATGVREAASHHHRRTGRPASAPGAGACASISPPSTASSPPAAAAGATRKPGVYPVHPLFASSPGTSPAGSAVAAPGSAVAAELNGQMLAAEAAADAVPGPSTEGRVSDDVADAAHSKKQHHSSSGGGSGGYSNPNAGHLHGILLNGPNSKPRSRSASPAPSRQGVSPCSSMKSVRFSFENLDQDLEGEVIATDGRPGRDDSDTCHSPRHRVGYSPRHSHTAVGHGELGARPQGDIVLGSSKEHARELEDLFDSIRSSATGSPRCDRSSGRRHHQQPQEMPPWMLQQRREQAKAAAMAAAAAARQAVAGSVADQPVPKKPPVHPVFGAMAWSAGASTSSSPAEGIVK